MNIEADRCWLCDRSPDELAEGQALAERITVNLRLRTGGTTGPAEVSEDAINGEVNDCPECGAPVLSHSAIARLHKRIEKAIGEVDQS